MAVEAKPLWLLDIDGVVNALSYQPVAGIWGGEDWLRRTVVTAIEGRGVMRLPILAARPVLDFVTRIHEDGLAEIRWHSTWRDSAVTAFAPTLGLPTSIPISVAPEWLNWRATTWWKPAAVERALAASRRVVWTDDHIGGFPDLTAAIAQSENALLISPNPLCGLEPEHLAQVESFLTR